MPASPLPGLFCELYWGQELNEARTFGPEVSTVLAAPDERAPLPLYGFTLAEEPFVLARRQAEGFRVYVPPRATVERSVRGAPPERLPPGELPREGGRPYVDAAAGTVLHLREGHLRLVVQPMAAPRREAGGRWRAAFVVLAAVVGTVTLPVGFLVFRTTKEEAEALTARTRAVAAERQEAERKRLEALYPTHLETDAGTPDGREQVRLPGSVRVR